MKERVHMHEKCVQTKEKPSWLSNNRYCLLAGQPLGGEFQSSGVFGTSCSYKAKDPAILLKTSSSRIKYSCSDCKMPSRDPK